MHLEVASWWEHQARVGLELSKAKEGSTSRSHSKILSRVVVSLANSSQSEEAYLDNKTQPNYLKEAFLIINLLSRAAVADSWIREWEVVSWVPIICSVPINQIEMIPTTMACLQEALVNEKQIYKYLL